eukprot:3477692-Prymnesium_polylepis.1
MLEPLYVRSLQPPRGSRAARDPDRTQRRSNVRNGDGEARRQSAIGWGLGKSATLSGELFI